jgi:UTP--glucose-1-phosphate uridylyltransferase
LPVTRAVPKELLPLGRRPLVQHVVDELADAGIEHAVLVTARGKTALIDHLDGLDGLPVRIATVRQAEPRGLGDAVLCAEGLTGSGPFAVALGDSLVAAAAVRALIAEVDDRGLDGAIAVERVAAERVGLYGVVATDAEGLVTGLAEKPEPGTAPSDLAVAARYVLPEAIFGALRATGPAAGGEVGLTEAIGALVRDGARIAAVPLPPDARRLDVGSPAGYAAAFTAHALADPELAPAVREAFAAHGDG